MDYSEAVIVVTSNYGHQANKITSSLSEDAVVTLASLCKSNNKRNLADYTIERLALMEPYRQCGYIANPFIQWLLDSATACSSQPVPQETNNVPVPNVNKPAPKPNDKPAPKPEPELEEDDGAMFDLFG